MKRLAASLFVGLFALGFAPFAHAEKIVLEGSTTVLPIAQKAAETFMQQNPGTEVVVRGGGSGVGIASILDGTCDVADSSRPIKDSELQKALTNGRDLKANVIAMDGIAVVVNEENKIEALSKKQVQDIYTGKISDWSEVGGAPGKIVVISRDSSSGTFEAFGTLALDGKKVRSDALMQASNQAIASTVQRTPGAIGYVGLGFMTGVKALSIDGVVPSKETVLSGKYKFGRPLFMYTDNNKSKDLVKQFIAFVKGPDGQRIADEEGFVALK